MYQLFYVLNGLINGEAGVEAVKIGGGDPSDLMTDGHYFSVEGDVDGRGPFRSIDEARAAAEAHQLTQVWCVTRDSPPTRRLVEPDDGEPEQDLVYVTKISDNSYMCVLTGAYEDLTLYMSASSFAHAARVYQAAYRAAYGE